VSEIRAVFMGGLSVDGSGGSGWFRAKAEVRQHIWQYGFLTNLS